ncbi:MAG: hypothetical protein HYR55_02135 [Acidobacteria bacterium]|nr:hypothetical protein [Acidobacteriota bacterium]MBI3655410.1 hypothetical protein [Acidobacteriota bacterium]
MPSIIYRSLLLYKLGLLLSYRSKYRKRYTTVAALVPDHVRVVDYCCGDAEIYTSHLKHRDVAYLGLDFNEQFIARLRDQRGVPCQVMNICVDEPVPADFSLMMASLYQFIPAHKALIDKILAYSKRFILVEPVRNNTESSCWFIRKLAYLLNDPGDGMKPHRFTPASFKAFLENYKDRLITLIEGDVEIVAVLKGDLDRL